MIGRVRSIAAAAACVVAAVLVAEGKADEGPDAPAADQEEYVRSIDEWHAQREARLRREDGWLTLVGLLPLGEGEFRFGSAAENDLVFPEGAPELGGVLTIAGGRARVTAGPGVVLRVEDEVVGECAMQSDADGSPTVVEMGERFSFFLIERAGKMYLRLKDRRAKALLEFEGIERYPVNLSWRLTARFEAYDPPRLIRVPNVLGYEYEEKCPGAAVFELDGVTCRLEPTGEPGQSLFFVFGDETNGRETYGGGRFLVAEPPAEDGTVVLDFNKAYNPPCVFTPYATCPLPPEQNHLPLRIEAGERMVGEAADAAHGQARGKP